MTGQGAARAAATPKVLHVYDAADVGATLVKYGRREGLPWRHFNRLPPSDTARGPSPGSRPARMAAELAWQAARAAGILRADLLHLHSGSRLGVVRSRPYRPFVLHFHGTDIRTQFYEPARRPALQWGADHAAVVLYSTPDLAEHAAEARSDAVYLPNPLDTEELPAWTPASRPRVVFASRWDDSKGGSAQLEAARSVLAAVGPETEVQGLDWGNGAAQAAALGVRLQPKMPKPAYLRWLASAHCVVGQSGGIMAMSELQAVGIGVPVVMRPAAGYYPGPSPVLQPERAEDFGEHVRKAIEDPQGVSAQLDGPGWVRANHGPERIVQQLAGIYAGI